MDALQYAELLVKSKRKILVVDDDYYIRLIFNKVQAKYECDVRFAPSGEEALQVLKQESFSVIFLDMKLNGGMSGLDVLREINHMDIISQVAIMTGSVDLNVIMEEANQLGVVSFLKKPVNFSLEYVEKVLARLNFPLIQRPTP